MTTQSSQLTMSSYELWKIINQFRLSEGSNKVRHDDFLARVVDECEELPVCEIFAVPSSGVEIKCYQLNQDQMLLVGMRESKAVRKKVLQWIRSLEEKQAPQIPQTYAAALLEAGRLALEVEKQAEQLAIAAPKVAFVDNLVDRSALINASQVAQKHKKSAVWLNKVLDELKVYNKAIKRGRTFQQWFVDKGLGEMKVTEQGYPQALFTNAGEVWINEKLITEGVV